ncbi:NADP-dependent oxidoreductase [Micromonospora mangrovi]|uniref:NADP-dependent oxidoreductase n=2 Tax=Micromonospora TaxID=1873 RepID=A0AAU8HNJ5_9ACTN
MRVIEVSQFGGPDVLREVDRPEPAPERGRVRVRVRAATVNPVDWLTRDGALTALLPSLTPPFILGWDFAGEVLDDGDGFRAGQRVAGMIPWFTVGTGAYAEVILVDPAWLAPLPDGVEETTAATVPLNGLTASQALDLARLPAGASLVVTGASGGVGGFAVQLAAAAGAHVIAVASRGDEEYVASLGAKTVLHRDGDLSAAIRALFPDGVDAVLDAAPAGPTLISGVRDGGTFVAVLDATLPAAERGTRTVKVSVQPDADRLAALLAALANGRLASRVADTVPLSDAPSAHRRAAEGGVRGKLVLTR